MTEKFFLLPTAEGERRMAHASAKHIAFKLTQMAVGDGGGVLPRPTRDRKALIGEKLRQALNSLEPDPDNPGQFIAELVIPPNVGGWWIREAGLFDEKGAMCFYSNVPETYKPLLSEGSGRSQVIRLVVLVTGNVEVELKIDPSTVLATRKQLDDRFANAVSRAAGTAAGIGADLAATNPAKGDLNALLTPGEYFYSAANPNYPSAAGVIKVWREDANQVYQLCQSRAGELFTRLRGANGTWSPWRSHAGLPCNTTAAEGVAAAIEASTGNEIYTPRVTLNRGVYLIWPYNCNFEVFNNMGSYYLSCFAKVDVGVAESGSINLPQVAPSVYHLPSFLVRVFSETAIVRFTLKNNGSSPPGRGSVRIQGGNINGFAFYGNKVI